MQDSALSCYSQQQSALNVVFIRKHLLYAQHSQVLQKQTGKMEQEQQKLCIYIQFSKNGH